MISAARPPLRILCSAGNARALLPLLVHEAVDGISTGVRVRGRAVYTDHPGWLGRLFTRLTPSRFRPMEPDPASLEALLRAMDGRSRLMLRVLGSIPDPAPEIARVLDRLPDRPYLLACSKDWDVVGRIAAWVPGLRVAYLVTREGVLRRYVQGRLDGSIREVPLRVHDALIHTVDEVRSLRGRAGWLGAWSVADAARARELGAWGVDFIASESLEALAVLSGDRAHDQPQDDAS